VVLGRDRLGWDFLGIVLGTSGITKYCIFLSILLLSFTMMCSLAQLIWLDRFPASLNEYKHWHLLFLTVLYTHLMCLDRSPESRVQSQYDLNVAYVTLRPNWEQK
jgi:hypothetical protein